MIDMKDYTTVTDLLDYIENEVKEAYYCLKSAVNEGQNEKVKAIKLRIGELEEQFSCVLVTYSQLKKHMLSKTCDAPDFKTII